MRGKRLISALVILLGLWALAGSTYKPTTFKGRSFVGRSFIGETFYVPASVDLPDSSGIDPVWAILATSGVAPTLFYGVDYDPETTKEAAYASIIAGPNNPGSGREWHHIYGDSTAGSAAGPHTSIAAFAGDSTAYHQDTLAYFIKIWDSSDAPLDSATGTLVLNEQADTQAPEITVSPTIALTYTGNGDTATVSYTGGTFSESCTKSLVVDYRSSYPYYGASDQMYAWKTRSVGVDSVVTGSPIAVPSFQIDHAYHTDSLLVVLQAIDLAGNRSALDTLYDGLVDMPLGTVPTLAHDEYGWTAAHLGGSQAVGNPWIPSGTGGTSPSDWATAPGIWVGLGHLSMSEEADGTDYGDRWLAEARALPNAKNVFAVEHTDMTIKPDAAIPAKYRHYLFAEYLLDSLRTAGSADTLCFMRGTDGQILYNSSVNYEWNPTHTAMHENLAAFYASEWNHSEARLPYTGYFFDVWDFNNTVYGYDNTADFNQDGTVLRSDAVEQAALIRGRVALFDSIRSKIGATNNDSVDQYFLLGGNSDGALVDTFFLKSLDVIQLEDFSIGRGDTGYIHPYVYEAWHNSIDENWTATTWNSFSLLFDNGDTIPRPADFTAQLQEFKTRMRTDSGGPFVIPEVDYSDIRPNPEWAEVFGLLADNMYPMYLRNSGEWPTGYYRQFWSPARASKDTLYGLGTASGAAVIDSNATTWEIRRTYSNGSVKVQLPNRAEYDAATDSLEYIVVVGSDTLRQTAGFSPSLDVEPPTIANFSYSYLDTAGIDIEVYAAVEVSAEADTGGSVALSYSWFADDGNPFAYTVEDTYSLAVFDDLYLASSSGKVAGIGTDLPDTLRAKVTVSDSLGNWSDPSYFRTYITRAVPSDVTAPTVTAYLASYDSTTAASDTVTLFVRGHANEDAYHRAAAVNGTDTLYTAWTDTIVAASDTLFWSIQKDSTIAQLGGEEYSMHIWAKDAADNVSDPDTSNTTVTRAAGGGGGSPIKYVFSDGSTMNINTLFSVDMTDSTDYSDVVWENGIVELSNYATITSDDFAVAITQGASLSDTLYNSSGSMEVWLQGMTNVASRLSGATIDSAKIYIRVNAGRDLSQAGEWLEFMIPTHSNAGDWTDGSAADDWDVSGNYADASLTTAWTTTFGANDAFDLGAVHRESQNFASSTIYEISLPTAGVQAWADGTYPPEIWIRVNGDGFIALHSSETTNTAYRTIVVVWGTQ